MKEADFKKCNFLVEKSLNTIPRVCTTYVSCTVRYHWPLIVHRCINMGKSVIHLSGFRNVCQRMAPMDHHSVAHPMTLWPIAKFVDRYLIGYHWHHFNGAILIEPLALFSGVDIWKSSTKTCDTIDSLAPCAIGDGHWRWSLSSMVHQFLMAPLVTNDDRQWC